MTALRDFAESFTHLLLSSSLYSRLAYVSGGLLLDTPRMATAEYSFAEEFQAIFIPKQRPAPDPVPDDMKAFVASFPPLGQVTQVKGSSLAFAVLLDVHHSRGNEPWQVAIWHSIDGGEWCEATLPLAAPEQTATSLQDNRTELARHSYAWSCSVQKSMKFTFKVRSGDEETWRWIRDEQGLEDGFVIVNRQVEAPEITPETLQDLIQDLNPVWQIASVMSQSPATSLWSLIAHVDAADGDDSTFADIPLGTPWGSFLR